MSDAKIFAARQGRCHVTMSEFAEFAEFALFMVTGGGV